MPTRIPFTALTGSITLPTGINFKIEKWDVQEDFRTADGEGLEDNGFSMPVQTGKSLKGTVTGSVTSNMAGIGAGIGTFQDVPFTATLASGIAISGNCTVSKFRAVVQVGKITTYECDFESFGAYSEPTWPQS